ncbi:MAG: type III pantothenate kinase [Candidatus Omnitrophica bacterium]|nr:type III pantothenate kinase [Candidatus Omnitrophota bacterium]
MLLAIDIGNTNISCGIFKGPRLVKKFDTPTKECFKSNLVRKVRNASDISASIICSVVPAQTKVISRNLAILTGKVPYIIGKDLTVPIKNLYHKPRQVGQDRLVNAYAASVLYAAPLIVIDSGTAITFDVISKNREYSGGLIFPGFEIAFRALNEKTALLPLVNLSAPRMLIGKDTQNSILSGVVFGISDLCKGIIARLRQELGKNTPVIGTGGAIKLIEKYSKINIITDKDLTLRGIELVYRYANK